MGGAKKPTPAKTGGQAPARKGKKDKSEGGPKRAEITVMVDAQRASKVLGGQKVVTAQELARQLGIKASAANAFLTDCVSKGTARRAGGYSGHRLYQAASS